MNGQDSVSSEALVSDQATSPASAGAPSPFDAAAGCAADVRALTIRGDWAEARDRFAVLVTRHQQRASRIALSYLHDAAEADEAVQDAFVKAFTHIGSYRADLSFDAWFTRILINGCLDRRRSLARRDRWFQPMWDAIRGARRGHAFPQAAGPSPEQALLAGEKRRQLNAAIDRLPHKQKAVFVLSQVSGHSAADIARIIGLNESTVRVHLFRAVRKLRALLRDDS